MKAHTATCVRSRSTRNEKHGHTSVRNATSISGSTIGSPPAVQTLQTLAVWQAARAFTHSREKLLALLNQIGWGGEPEHISGSSPRSGRPRGCVPPRPRRVWSAGSGSRRSSRRRSNRTCSARSRRSQTVKLL